MISFISQFGRKKKKYRGKVNSTSSSKDGEKKEAAKDEEEEDEEEEDGDLSKYKLDVRAVTIAGNLTRQIYKLECYVKKKNIYTYIYIYKIPPTAG